MVELSKVAAGADTTALCLSIVALVIAAAAAGFTAWQAWTAARTRKASNERRLVDWAAPEWAAPEAIEVELRGPDEARKVWAELTVGGHAVTTTARRLRPGEQLHFRLPSEVEAARRWSDFEARAPRGREPSDELTAFTYGLRITWHSPLGTASSLTTDGYINRRVRSEPPAGGPPWPEVKPLTDGWTGADN